jgi:hypothetical protein
VCTRWANVADSLGYCRRKHWPSILKKKAPQKKQTANKKSTGTNSKIRIKAKPSRSPSSKSKPIPRGDFSATFAKLKEVMSGFADELHVSTDEPKKYYLVTKSKSWKGGPMFFGAVMMGKAYASDHLLPLYVCPELTKTISPELKKRMQGKACFNFREPDAKLFAQLRDVTRAGLEKYRAKKWL